ncbi:MAG: DUF4276 family protein [Candidatus Hydrogenedentes bacterium]|nr:DUF4276 family protein [Candidatus Hydrogenedentota bacterium]
MSRLVFLLEERSMKTFLDVLIPRLFPDLPFLCVPHEGKQDLEKSIPRKLRAWKEPGVRFVVLRDNDGADCHALKQRLTALCEDAERGDTLVRIACQELEAWYLGEPDALAEAYNDDSLRTLGNLAPFRDPDAVLNPARELANRIPAFQKVSGARQMGARLSMERNTSRSFRKLVSGVRRIVADQNPSK